MPTVPQTAGEQPPPEAITVSPFYHSAVNEVTKPGSLVFMSHYFARKWAPDLGALGVAIVLCLRDRCYHDRRSGEKRDRVEKLPVREIARACGVSEKTVRREFDRNAVLKKFVAAEYEYKAGRVAGSVLEDAYSYRVAMDDPVHPSDEAALVAAVRARAEAQEKGNDPNTREAAKRRAREAASAPAATPGQSDQAWTDCPGGLDKLTRGMVNLTRGVGQIDQASIVKESSESLKNPLSPPPELSLALSEEEEPAWRRAYFALSDAARQAWTARASAEAPSHGVRPSNVPAVVRLARELFRQHLEQKDAGEDAAVEDAGEDAAEVRRLARQSLGMEEAP